MPTDQAYTISELATLAGVTPRTIRYYVSIGLLPSPGQGPGDAVRGRAPRAAAPHPPAAAGASPARRDHRAPGGARRRSGGRGGGRGPRGRRDRPLGNAVRSGSRVGPRVHPAIEGRDRSSKPRHAIGIRSAAAPLPRGHHRHVHRSPRRGQASSAPQWERVTLSQNVELHVRRPAGRLEQKRVERLIRLGRELLEGGQPT